MTSTRRQTAREAASVTRDLMLAPMVVAMRMPIMAAEAGKTDFSGYSESLNAVSEKWTALGEGVVAAQLAFLRGAFLLPLALAKASSPVEPLIEMADSVATAALKPAAIQVRRNHRRLSRRK